MSRSKANTRRLVGDNLAIGRWVISYQSVCAANPAGIGSSCACAERPVATWSALADLAACMLRDACRRGYVRRPTGAYSLTRSMACAAWRARSAFLQCTCSTPKNNKNSGTHLVSPLCSLRELAVRCVRSPASRMCSCATTSAQCIGRACGILVHAATTSYHHNYVSWSVRAKTCSHRLHTICM